jgi:hypothetical protein
METIGPLDRPSDYLPPFCYDVMLTDIKPEDLPGKLSSALGKNYLSSATGDSTWPIIGKIWGPNHRLLVTLPVSLGAIYINVHFIFDTGAPTTYIAKSVLNALFIEEWELFEKPVKVNGVRVQLTVSDTTKFYQGGDQFKDCHFKGLNVLGMDYVDRVNALLEVNFSTKLLRLDRQPD